MTKKVIGIRFKPAGKIYYFDPLDFEINQFDHAVVETVQGIEYGEVALGPREIDEESFPFPVKPILRKSTRQDDQHYLSLKEKEEKARAIFEEKAKDNDLDMRLVNVEYTFDRKKAIFYFIANGRVDFRNLVKDLSIILRVRIELRQIGVRDEAKQFNTLGCCGRDTCCSQWLGNFAPVSIKMAKDQNLSLNSAKISGICGRLLCCLNFENEFYKDVIQKMPKVGETVETPDGEGPVYRLDVLRENVTIKFQNEKDEILIKTYPLSDIRSNRKAPKPQEKNPTASDHKEERMEENPEKGIPSSSEKQGNRNPGKRHTASASSSGQTEKTAPKKGRKSFEKRQPSPTPKDSRRDEKPSSDQTASSREGTPKKEHRDNNNRKRSKRGNWSKNKKSNRNHNEKK